MSAEFWAILGTGLGTLILTLAAQVFFAGKMRGEVSIRLEDIGKDVSELKIEQDDQWREINNQGQRISRMEGPNNSPRPNGGYRG